MVLSICRLDADVSLTVFDVQDNIIQLFVDEFTRCIRKCHDLLGTFDESPQLQTKTLNRMESPTW